MKFLIAILLGFAGCTSAFAQSGNVNIVVGKVLSPKDSVLVQELFFDALHEKLVENYPAAVAIFSRILEIDPGNAPAMYELANINLAANKDREAERLARNAVTVDPGNEWYWALLAEIYKKNNNLPELLLVLEELIDVAADKERFYYDKANALSLLRRVEEAATTYAQIEEKFGASEALIAARQRMLLSQGRPAEVQQELERQIAAEPGDLRNYIYLSELYTKAGDTQKAIAILNKAKEVDPASAIVRLALADSYRALNQFDNTIAELKVAFEDPALAIDEKVRILLSFFPLFKDANVRARTEELAAIATRIHPDEARAFAIYGDVLSQQKKYPEAREAYRTAVKIDDQIYQIWEQLVRIEVSQGEFSQAIDDGEQALLIFPNQAELYLFTAIAYAQTKKHDKAVNYLKSAADLELDDNQVRAQIFATMGDSYNALQKYKESDAAYENALQLDPDNSYALNNYAYYLSLRGESLEKAEKMSRRSLQLDPNNASAEDTYAWILFKLKRYQEARTWIERSLSKEQGKSAVQVEHYGDILYFLGERDKALQQWQQARTLGSDSPKLQQKINEKKYID